MNDITHKKGAQGRGRTMSAEDGEARAMFRDHQLRSEKNFKLLGQGVSFYVEIRGRTVELVCLSCERPARWSNRTGLFQCPECQSDLDNDQFEYLAGVARDALNATLSELAGIRGEVWWRRLWRRLFRT